MPKEAVYGEPLTVENATDEQPIVEVRWSRETGDMQIVTRVKEYEVSLDALPSCKYGMYVTIDRRGVNDLIRHLRRARDQAFGRDE